ncbi:MAG: hypothetical protein IJP02_03585 [Oscillospiraceae bacterium]|nr:hypothetical protein [Oscillospiraceae bacterium]
MKKEICLPLAAWLGGLGGFALRRWELAEAYNAETKLMELHTATWLLCALSAGLVLWFVLACRGMEKRKAEDWFYAPSTGYILLCVCSGIVLLMAGGIGLWQQMSSYEPDLLIRLASAACLLGGAATLAFTRKVYRGLWSSNGPLPLMAVCLAAVLWLICLYQQHARQPEVQLFIWQVLSGIALVLGLYSLVCLAMGKGSAARCCVLSLLAIVWIPTALADGAFGLSLTMVWIFGAVYLTAQCYMLLRSAFGQPWAERMCPPAQENDETESEA